MTATFTVRHALLFIAVSSTALLVGCGQARPTEQDVVRNIGAGCTLVSHEKFVKISEDSKGFQVVSTKFQADCTPQGGTIKRRITGTMVFDQWQDWFSKSWSFKATTLDVDRLAKTAQSKLMYSDGPECNARLERVATEVVACLQTLDPKSAERLNAWLEQAKNQSEKS